MPTEKSYRGFSKKRLYELLQEMILIRVFEDKAGFDYRLRKIGGFCHLCTGQEAIYPAIYAAIDPSKDYVLTSYRDHGHAISSGIEPKNIMAELYGKGSGCSRGKGGSMHLFNAEKGFLGGNGIVGGQIPVATGTAFAQKYKKDKGVTLCFFGDGAVSQGAFHESINLAKLWKLPCIYVIENNKYGMGTAIDRASAFSDLAKAGTPYGVEGIAVDAMNFFSTYEAFAKAVETARNTNEPFLIECQTYRYYGHSMSDPAKYRTKEELNEFKKQDPIEQMKQELRENGMITDEEIADIEKHVDAVVKDSQKFAEDSPEPGMETIYEDILA